MGYVSDWLDWEDHAAAVQARFPDCTRGLDCPASDHIVDCRRFRRERRERRLMPSIRILVCGGRDYNDVDSVFRALDNISSEFRIEAIIEGGATGADTIARDYARAKHIPCETYEADWRNYGKAAGPKRNKRMLIDGAPDMVLACPGGRGTANMVRQALDADVEVKFLGSSS